ncbi:hypothetical protein ACJMK2_004363, partial [Sinanodonta woodiana]
YASTIHTEDPARKDNQVRRKLREAYYTHVNLRYKSIDDPSISITLILQHFTFFQ